MRQLLRRLWTWCKRQIADPALDLLGAGVLATLTGRVAFYVVLIPMLLGGGWTGQALALAVLATIDLLIHAQVLAVLQRTMASAVFAEITS